MSMLSPKRTKFRKMQKGRTRGTAKGGNEVSFGDFGLQVQSPGWLTARQIEAARVAISRSVKKFGKIYVRVFPDHPFTKKPAETRMGTGKGGVEGWVAVVKPGRVMFELSGVDEELAREAMRLAGHKLPIKTKFVMREGAGQQRRPPMCTIWTTRSWWSSSTGRARRSSTCASSTQPGSWRTPAASRTPRRIWRGR